MMNRRHFLQSLASIGVLSAFPPSIRSASQPFLKVSSPDRLLQDLVEAAIGRGASYADARFVEVQQESLQVRRDQLYTFTRSETAGVALRAYKNGNWGFAATSSANPDPALLASDACSIAEQTGKIQSVPFIEEGRPKSVSLSWSSPFQKDPFTVPVKEKTDFLIDLSISALKTNEIAFSVANLFSVKRHVRFFSSLDASVEQTFLTIYPNFGVTIFDQRTGQIDSRSSALEPLLGGYEIVTTHPFREELSRAIEELKEYQKAPALQTGEYDVITDPTHLWRLLYETLVPHLDPNTILGIDGGIPVFNLFTKDSVGKKAFDASLLTLDFDYSRPSALATFGYDDAGRKPSSGTILENGILRGFPLSDELPLDVGTRAALCSRAGTWQSVPRFAMPNLSLRPSTQDHSLNDIIAGTERGVLLSGRGQVSLSTNRKWFRGGSQIAWLIENGIRKHMVRDFTYDTSLLYFLNVLADVGGAATVVAGGDLFPQNVNSLWELPFSVAVPSAKFEKVNLLSSRAG